MRYLPPKRRSVRLAALALTAAASLALAACGGGNGGNAAPGAGASGGGGGGGGSVAVTLITKDNNNPFFVAMQKGAKDEGAKDGVTITWPPEAKDGDEDGQVKAIEAAMARGDKGILITPNGPGVNSAIEKAKDAGLFVIALDTPPDPPDTVDITIATDNFKAGELIGKWAAGPAGREGAKIALLDLFNDKIVSVDYNRDQGFLTGMGIDAKDKAKNGDEDKSGKYTGGKGGNYTIVCNEPLRCAQDRGKTAMETCLSKNQDINLVYTINEPAGRRCGGGPEGCRRQRRNDRLRRRRLRPGVAASRAATIGATSQQYPVKMAQLGR